MTRTARRKRWGTAGMILIPPALFRASTGPASKLARDPGAPRSYSYDLLYARLPVHITNRMTTTPECRLAYSAPQAGLETTLVALFRPTSGSANAAMATKLD